MRIDDYDDSNNETAVDIANRRFTVASKYWRTEFFARAAKELEFASGEKQWDDYTKMAREQDGRPCLQLNRIGTYLRNLNARNRAANLSITVKSQTSATNAQADTFNAILKKITEDSKIENALDASSYYQIATGLGYIRVTADYANYYDFDQNLTIEHIADPSTVYYDPACKDMLFADAEYAFVVTTLHKDEYKALVPSSKISESMSRSGKFAHNVSPMILDQDHIIVAEYYYKEWSDITLYKYADPATGETKVVEKSKSKLVTDNFVKVNERKTRKCVVKHCLFDGTEMHNETELPGLQRMPVIPLLGETAWNNGRLNISGAVRNAIDAQRLLNYSISIGLECADLAAKSPWIVQDASIDGYEDFWRDASSRNYAYLPYRKNTEAPVRNSVNTDISALMSIKQESANDIQSIFGVFDTQLGDESNAESGVAIQSRNSAAQKNTFVYLDNLLKTTKEIGRVLVDAIPHYYNGRNIEIQNSDGTSQIINVKLDEMHNLNVIAAEQQQDVTQKQLLNNALLDISTKLPNAAPLLLDAIVANSDLPNAEKIVARLKTLLPPEVQQMENNSENMSPDELKAALAAQEMQVNQGQKQMQDMQQQLQAAQQEIDKLKSDNSLAEMKLQLEQIKAQQDYDIAQKELLIEQTKIETNYAIETHKLQYAEVKLASEVAGVKSDDVEI